MYMSVETCLSLEHPYYRRNNIEIYLDGERQAYVVELDTLGTLNEPRGWIRRHKVDENGNVVFENGETLIEVVYGNVEVKIK